MLTYLIGAQAEWEGCYEPSTSRDWSQGFMEVPTDPTEIELLSSIWMTEDLRDPTVPDISSEFPSRYPGANIFGTIK